MSKSIFVVMETSFEYDDQTYTPSSDGGGKPIRAFKKETEAVAFATEKNIQALRAMGVNGLMNYSEDMDYLFTDIGAAEELLGLPEETLTNDGWDALEGVVEKLDDEKLLKLGELLYFTFFEVMEVEQD